MAAPRVGAQRRRAGSLARGGGRLAGGCAGPAPGRRREPATVVGMGMENSKPPRPTVRLDRDELQRLTRASGEGAGAEEGAVVAPVSAAGSEPAPVVNRTSTLHDPLTMALLAEVARTSRTMDLDPDKLAEAHAAADEPLPAHPNLKRR